MKNTKLTCLCAGPGKRLFHFDKDSADLRVSVCVCFRAAVKPAAAILHGPGPLVVQPGRDRSLLRPLQGAVRGLAVQLPGGTPEH